MAEYTVESITHVGVIIEDNIVQLREQIVSKFKYLCASEHLEIEFKPLTEISKLIVGDEAKIQINRKYMYGRVYSINLKNHDDCEIHTSMHLNNCFEVFSTGDSLEERFNTCRVPIAIDGDKAKELEECITDMNDALDHLDKCKFLVDSGIGALQEFVHKV